MTHEILRSRLSRTASILPVALTAFVAAWLGYLLCAEALASAPAGGGADPSAAALVLELGRTLCPMGAILGAWRARTAREGGAR